MRKYLTNDYLLLEIDNYSDECWILVESPDDDDRLFLSESLGIPDSFIDSIDDEDENPRIDEEAGWTLTLLRIPITDNPENLAFKTVPVGVMTRDNLIVTVCHYHNEVIPAFINNTRHRRRNIKISSTFILYLMFTAAFYYLQYLKTIYHGFIEAQQQMERSVRNSDLLRMMQLQKSLLYFSTSLRGNEVLLDRLQRTYPDNLDRYLLDDVEIELKQAESTVNIYNNIIAVAMDTFESVISNNLNNVMKRMTSLSLILMVPTIIASWYGMNVDVGIANLPLAFLYIVIASIILSALAYALMRKLRWF